MSVGRVLRAASFFVVTATVTIAVVPACGLSDAVCEYPNGTCMNYSQGECTSGKFTPHTTCEALGYHRDPAGGAWKK